MTAPLKPLIPHVGHQLKLWQNGHGCSNARLIITAKTACVDGHSVAADDHVVGVADFLVVPCWMRWRGGEEGGWGLVGAGGGGGGGNPRRTRASAGVASASVPSGVIHKRVRPSQH